MPIFPSKTVRQLLFLNRRMMEGNLRQLQKSLEILIFAEMVLKKIVLISGCPEQLGNHFTAL